MWSRSQYFLLRTEIKESLKNTFPARFFLLSRDICRAIKYYAQYYRKILGDDSVSRIQVIAIEFCSICNLSCRYCYLERKNRPHFLSVDIYKKLLSELSANKRYNIKIMEWPVSGCIFLHPEYKEIVTLTKEYKERYQNFSPWVILNDNMMLFEKEKVDFMLEQGVINQIICSIDGNDKNSFEYMRPNANFEKVIENTQYLIDKNKRSKKRIVIQINLGYGSCFNSKKFDVRIKKILNDLDHFTVWKPHNWNESFHTETDFYAPARYFCSYVFESIGLSTSGLITKCPMDLKELTAFGDFTKNALERIWLSDERRAFLRLMYEGKRHLIPGCSNCSISYVRQNKFAHKR